MKSANVHNHPSPHACYTVASIVLIVFSCMIPMKQAGDMPTVPSQSEQSQHTIPDMTKTLTQRSSTAIAISSDPHFASKTSNANATSNILKLCESWFQQNYLQGLIILGDYVDWGGNSKAWKEAVLIMKHTAPQLFIWGLAGNHDLYGNGLANWFRYSMKPQDIAFQQVPYWKLQLHDIHFIGLYLPWSHNDFDAKQKVWLQKILCEIPNNHFIVILTHSFFYASGYYDFWSGIAWYDNRGNIEHVAPLFKDRADLVVSGHNHYMEWIEQDGTNWVIIGAMGGKPDPKPTYFTKGSQFFKRAIFGLLLVERIPEGLRCSFIDEHGTTLYSKTLTKQE